MSSPTPITVTITVEFDPESAWQLAQFVKRVGYSTAIRHTDQGDQGGAEREARAMLAAFAKVRAALAGAGYAPR